MSVAVWQRIMHQPAQRPILANTRNATTRSAVQHPGRAAGDVRLGELCLTWKGILQCHKGTMQIQLRGQWLDIMELDIMELDIMESDIMDSGRSNRDTFLIWYHADDLTLADRILRQERMERQNHGYDDLVRADLTDPRYALRQAESVRNWILRQDDSEVSRYNKIACTWFCDAAIILKSSNRCTCICRRAMLHMGKLHQTNWWSISTGIAGHVAAM